MDMTESEIDILVLVIGGPLFCLGIYLWAKAARHMYGLLTNFKPGKEWGRFLAFSIFMPHFFTEKGNLHRKQMLKYSGYFILLCGTPFVIVGVKQALSL